MKCPAGWLLLPVESHPDHNVVPFPVSKAVIPLMMDTGGSVINIASRAAKVPPLFNGAYAVAKAGVVMLTKVNQSSYTTGQAINVTGGQLMEL